MAEPCTPEPGSIEALGAFDLHARIASADLTARAVAETLLDRITELDSRIRAFAWLDPDHVRAQADALDAWARAGRPLGPLHGVPVAVKDIIDTRGIPTEYGCAVTRGHVPNADAAVVERLWAAGALVMGKTVSTELAFMHPGPTRNPLNPDHSPGGSSSGSAAAVAAGMVPLAIGSQTGGSVTRPAGFCGITGFKPSFGMISRRGVLTQSPTLDTLGVFARDPRDAALLADVLSGPDPADPATRDTSATDLAGHLAAPGDRPLRLALVRLPDVAEAHHAELKTWLDRLPAGRFRIEEHALPEVFARVAAARELINFAEMAHHYRWIENRDRSGLSDRIRAAMDQGKQATAGAYLDARALMTEARDALARAFAGYDAILSTATAGRAPEGIESTGTAICNGLWTFTGAPAVNLPVRASRVAGLPISVQITACRGHDGAALRVAARLHPLLDDLAA